MNYLRKSNNEGRKNLKPFIYILIVVCVLFLLNTVAPNFLGNTSATIALPLWKFRGFVVYRFKTVVEAWNSKENLVQENTALREKILAVETTLLDRDMLTRENQTLRGMLGKNGVEHMTLAEVLARPPQSAYDSIILDVGSDKGVKVGDKIVYPPRILLGEIIGVNARTSKAKLYTTGGETLDAIFDKENISAQLKGLGSGNFEVDLPREIHIDVGDLLVTAGGNHFIVGKVGNISFDVADAIQKVLVTSPVNFSELRFVEVASSTKTI